MPRDNGQRLARRREFLAGVGSTGATIALAGCTGSTGGNMGSGSGGGTAGTADDSLSGTTITHLQYSSAQSNANKAVKEQFEEETGINVQIEAVPFGDLLSKTLTVLESNGGNYDIIDADMSLLPKFASLGGLHSLDKMVKNSSVISPDLFPNKVWKDAAIYGPPDNINPQTADKTYINQIPYQTNIIQGYHRTDLYGNRNVKPPDTISEYIDVAKKLTNAGEGIHGMGMMAAQHSSVLVEWKSEYYGTGQGFFKGEVVDPKADIQGWSQSRTPDIYNNQTVKSLEKYVERAQADYSPKSVTSWDWTDLTRNFVQGKLATAQAFSSTARTANNPDKSQIAGEVGYHIYPGVGTGYPGIKSKSDLPVKPVTRTPHYGSWCLAIPANSKKKEAAWRWIEYLNKMDVMIERAKHGAQPSQSRAYDYLTKPKNEVFPSSPSFFESLWTGVTEWGVGRPKIPSYLEWRNMMTKWLNRAANGRVSPDEALKNAQRETENIVTIEG